MLCLQSEKRMRSRSPSRKSKSRSRSRGRSKSPSRAAKSKSKSSPSPSPARCVCRLCLLVCSVWNKRHTVLQTRKSERNSTFYDCYCCCLSGILCTGEVSVCLSVCLSLSLSLSLSHTHTHTHTSSAHEFVWFLSVVKTSRQKIVVIAQASDAAPVDEPVASVGAHRGAGAAARGGGARTGEEGRWARRRVRAVGKGEGWCRGVSEVNVSNRAWIWIDLCCCNVGEAFSRTSSLTKINPSHLDFTIPTANLFQHWFFNLITSRPMSVFENYICQAVWSQVNEVVQQKKETPRKRSASRGRQMALLGKVKDVLVGPVLTLVGIACLPLFIVALNAACKKVRNVSRDAVFGAFESVWVSLCSTFPTLSLWGHW